MRHQTRIQLSFSIVVLVFLGVLAVQLVFFSRFSGQVQDLVGGKLRLQEAVQSAREAVLRIRADIWDTLLFRSDDRHAAIARLDRHAKDFYDARRSLSALLPQAPTSGIYDLDADFRIYYLFAKDILALPDLGAFTATLDFTAKFQDNQDRLERRLDTFNGQVKANFDATLADLDAGMRATAFITILFPGLAVALAVTISLFLARRITRPLSQLCDLARQAAAGNYQLHADLATAGKSDDELTALGDAFNHLMATIQAYREHMEELVGERTRAMEEANWELQASLETLKETQEHLIQSEKMAALGPLVAGVAHEVNTPIGNSITASSYLENRIRTLRADFEGGSLRKADMEEFLGTSTELSRIMSSNLHRAGDLIASFKRVAVDQQSNERRQFDLRDYISEIITSHRPLFKGTPHQILNHADPHIAMDTHPGALYQILSNLITNSLRHGFRGDDAGTVSVEARQIGADVVIDYRDDGRGIPEVHRKHIFDPFYTTLRNEGGSGLGLYIAFTLASGSLGGRLSLQENGQPGVHFHLRVPRVLPREPD